MGSRRQECSGNDQITANIENGLLCKICAQSLKLGGTRDMGALVVSQKDFKGRISYPVEGCIESDFQIKPRLVTPPLLPELSDGCRFCCKVKAEFDKAFGPSDSWKLSRNLPSFKVEYLWIRDHRDHKDTSRALRWRLEGLELTLYHPSHENHQVRFYVAASSSDPCRKWLGIKKIPLDVKSGFTGRKITIIQDWLNECALNSKCSRASEMFESPFIPSRVLDIGIKDNNDSFIKLIDTKALDLSKYAPKLRYICLSYCWGTDEQLLKTTKENIEQYKENISINSNMPLVFRDTISVARKLGVRYLWIDALCIIQEGDNGQDWAKQSTMMGDVFIHAWMTIAAAVPSSCQESLFSPQYNRSIEVEFTSYKNTKASGKFTIILITSTSSSFINPSRDSRWNSRGWV